MKRVMLILGFVFLMGLASASLSLTNDLNDVYNVGDNINLEIIVTAEEVINEVLLINFVCGSGEVEAYKEFVSLDQGNIVEKDVLVPLIKDFIGELKGSCYIEAGLGNAKQKLSGDFKVSDLINLDISYSNSEFSPGEKIILSGIAKKENNDLVEGIVEVKLIIEGGNSLEVSEYVTEGNFQIELTLPENTKAGKYALNIEVYDTALNGIIRNKGILMESLQVRQVPNNLEIIFEEVSIVPGTSLRMKTVLHDQTGENINAKSFIAIKNNLGITMKQIETINDEFVNYEVTYNESPNEWKVSVYSEEIISEKSFFILEKKDVKLELVGDILYLTNIGNIIYDELVEVKIGEEIVTIEPNLGIGQIEKYTLSAPEGEYSIQVGDFEQSVSLTGRVIKAKKINGMDFKFNPFGWIFVVLVLGFVSYGLFRKGFKKSFFGKRTSKVRRPFKEKVMEFKEGFIESKDKLSLSLSMVGSKQDASMVCLRIKNYDDLKSGVGGIRELFQKIADLVEKEKGLVYENKNNFYFVFAPVRTKTFHNEMQSIKLAEEIRKILEGHNKLFKQKIDFGFSVNYGTIVTKLVPGKNDFMPMGNLMMNSRKIANHSKKELFLSEDIKERVKVEFKTQKHETGGLKYFRITEAIKRGNHTTFIKGFLDRQQRSRMAANNK